SFPLGASSRAYRAARPTATIISRQPPRAAKRPGGRWSTGLERDLLDRDGAAHDDLHLRRLASRQSGAYLQALVEKAGRRLAARCGERTTRCVIPTGTRSPRKNSPRSRAEAASPVASPADFWEAGCLVIL